MITKTTKDQSNGRAQVAVEEFMNRLVARHPLEKEFLQSVHQIANDVIPFTETKQKYRKLKIFERICVPERVIMFRVPWIDDKGEYRINRGYRVEMNTAMGPPKGGLRFHPKVNLSVMKFLAFEQVFKSGLTTLRWGGGKSGSEFDPKGKSDNEVMRFCQSFMNEMYRYLGTNTDIPLGDIGVGTREIGYVFGQYRRLGFTGIPSQEGAGWGGSLVRPEATGNSCAYFCKKMLETRFDTIDDKICTISGSGNVAQYAAEKIIQLGGKVVTLSDSNGFIYDKEGLNEGKLSYVMKLKNVNRGRISEYAKKFKKAQYFPGKQPWGVKCDIAIPCASQNTLQEDDAKELIKNSCKLVCEGADMACSPAAITHFTESNVLFAPSKASTATALSISGLEVIDVSERLAKLATGEIDAKLQESLNGIHEKCVKYGKENGHINYVKGANIAGFVKVANAMMEQGLV